MPTPTPLEGSLASGPGPELEPLPPDKDGEGELASPRAERAELGTTPRQLRSVITVAAVVLLTVAVVVLSVVAVHFERQSHALRGRLGLAQQTRPNLGELAYDGGEMLALRAPPGTQVAASIAFVAVLGAPAESVWVSILATGLDPNVEFDMETQACDGSIGYSLDRGGSFVDGSRLFHSEQLGLPATGRAYNVVIRRYRGTDVTGFTIRPDKSIHPLAIGASGC